MTSDSLQLLKQLEPIVRPAYAGGSAPPTGALENQPFDELLARARQGQVASGRTVTADRAGELSGEQVARLSSAADLAEASGAQRALLLMDGRGLLLDVASRVISAELSADDTSRLANLDAAVYVPGDDDASSPALLAPPSGVAPPGVGRQLDAAMRPSAA